MSQLTRTSWTEAEGTSIRGHVGATFGQLVLAFGAPDEGDGYKTQAEWTLRAPSGVIVTVYDWKQDVEPAQVTLWNVGGNGPAPEAVRLVERALGI